MASNLWEDMGVDAPKPGMSKVFTIRIDEPLVQDLRNIRAALRNRGYKTTISELIRGAARALANELMEELQLTPSEPHAVAAPNPHNRRGPNNRVPVSRP
jgi:hypothetical protein